MNDKWNEAIRLLHKFCPKSKAIIIEKSKLKLDTIYELISWIDPSPIGGVIDRFDDSLALFDNIYGKFLQNEVGRVVVFPDIIWDAKPPFICAVKTLRERIDDGVKTQRFEDIELWESIDGCTDALFVFETSGNVLFFDHNEGYQIGRPKYK